MEKNLHRAEIIAGGLVQGVGFRYYVLRSAVNLNLNGYTKNLYSGEVLTVVEGDKFLIEELFTKIKIGPRYAKVNNVSITWSEYKGQFKSFEITD